MTKISSNLIKKDKLIDLFKKHWFLIILFLFALILRTIYLRDTIALGVDQVDHYSFAKEIFSRGYIWHGARALRHICNGTQIEAYLGPFYIYLLALPAKIGNWNFVVGSAFNGFLNAAAVFFLYYLAKLLTGSKTVGYIAATFFALSAAFVIASRTVWNPFYLPLFLFVMFIAFVKLVQSKEKYLLLFVLFFSLTTQFHASVFLFIPAFILLWLVYKIEIKKKILWFYAGLIFVFSYLPLLFHEAISNFSNLRNYYQIIFKASECDGQKAGYFHSLGSTIQKFFSSTYLSLNGRAYESAWGLWSNRTLDKVFRYLLELILVIILGIIIIQFVQKRSLSKEKNLLFIIPAIIIIFILGANFFGYTLYEYYYIAIIPLVYIALACGLEKIAKYPPGKLIAIILLVIFVFFNLRSLYNYIDARRHRAQASELNNPNMLLEDQLALLDFMKSDSQNKGAVIDYYLYYQNREDVYRYLIDLKQLKVSKDGDIVYLIVDPKWLDEIKQLQNKIIFEKDFESIKLIKYQQ